SMSLAFSPGKTSLAGLDWLNLLLSKSLLPPHPVTIGGICMARDLGAWMRSSRATMIIGVSNFAGGFNRRRGPTTHCQYSTFIIWIELHTPAKNIVPDPVGGRLRFD